jgi:hypothetical protein
MNDDISATDDEVGLDEDIEPGAEAAEGVKGGVRLSQKLPQTELLPNGTIEIEIS